jgi:hypothetical protein
MVDRETGRDIAYRPSQVLESRTEWHTLMVCQRFAATLSLESWSYSDFCLFSDLQGVERMNDKHDNWLLRLIKRRVSAALTILLLTLIVALIFGPRTFAKARVFFAWDKVQAATLTMLSSEKLTFLVTDKLVTQVMITKETTGARRILLGNDTDIMATVVTLYYGVDLQKIDKESITRSPSGDVLIRIPEPEVLEIKVHESETRVFQKQTGLTQLIEVLSNSEMERFQALRSAAEKEALTFFKNQNQLPTREEIVEELNTFSHLLSEPLGVAVIFE